MNLDQAAVRRVLDMRETINAVEAGLAAFSAGKVVQPVRMVVPAENGGVLGLMPAYTGSLGVKLVTVYPHNEEHGLPSHIATIMLFNPKTGEPLATMDGTLITEVRTAAASAVATKHLARKDASVLTLLGAGVQARSHLEAMRCVREFAEVRVWSPRHGEQFAREYGIHAAASAEEAVRGADVICTVTSSTTPVLLGEWLKPGAHINAVGACFPTQRELDDETLRRSRIYTDSREAALKESGDIIAAGRVDAEVGEVIAGAAQGRTSPEEITLFKSLGLAVEDVVTADLVYRKASGGS